MRKRVTSEHLAARDQVLDAARALLSGDIDVLHAADRISGYVSLLDPKYEDPDLRTFVAISSDTDKYLMVDSVRGWHPDVREAREAEYRSANDTYKEAALRAAHAVVGKLAPPV